MHDTDLILRSPVTSSFETRYRAPQDEVTGRLEGWACVSHLETSVGHSTRVLP